MCWCVDWCMCTAFVYACVCMCVRSHLHTPRGICPSFFYVGMIKYSVPKTSWQEEGFIFVLHSRFIEEVQDGHTRPESQLRTAGYSNFLTREISHSLGITTWKNWKCWLKARQVSWKTNVSLASSCSPGLATYGLLSTVVQALPHQLKSSPSPQACPQSICLVQFFRGDLPLR